MKISEQTIEGLIEIITGSTQKSPHRSDRELIKFFNKLGERDLYGPSFPGGTTYVRGKLTKFNGTEGIKRVICSAFDSLLESDFDEEWQADWFNGLLEQDGYRLNLENSDGGYPIYEGNEFVDFIEAPPYFEVTSLAPEIIVPEGLAAISHDGVREQISKAKKRIAEGDVSGAISTSYTLVEQLLKHILEDKDVVMSNKERGNIRKLFQKAAKQLDLDSGSDTIADHLKPILDGLQKIVLGLYEVSNNAGDRHAGPYNPAPRHATLSVNAATTLSGFLVDTHNHLRCGDAHTEPNGSGA